MSLDIRFFFLFKQENANCQRLQSQQDECPECKGSMVTTKTLSCDHAFCENCAVQKMKSKQPCRYLGCDRITGSLN